MKTGTFMDLISSRYKDIKSQFKSRSFDGAFDEDAFNDAFIKCAMHFNNDMIDYDCAVKYLFTAYKNTHMGNLYKEHEDLKESFDIDLHDKCDDDDDAHTRYAQAVYDDVMKAVSLEYSEDDMLLYSLYKYNGWTAQDLTDAGYDCSNIKAKVKDIHQFVRKYCKTHFKKSR